MIYRLYFVARGERLRLTEAAHQELLVNDLDPNLNAKPARPERRLLVLPQPRRRGHRDPQGHPRPERPDARRSEPDQHQRSLRPWSRRPSTATLPPTATPSRPSPRSWPHRCPCSSSPPPPCRTAWSAVVLDHVGGDRRHRSVRMVGVRHAAAGPHAEPGRASCPERRRPRGPSRSRSASQTGYSSRSERSPSTCSPCRPDRPHVHGPAREHHRRPAYAIGQGRGHPCVAAGRHRQHCAGDERVLRRHPHRFHHS